MTYEQIVAETRKYFDHADASLIQGHLAVQFNITGEGEGAFYVEVKDGKAMTEPYEYYDRDAIIYITGDTLVEILNGKLTLDDAYNELRLGIEGDLGAALLLKTITPVVKDDKEVAKEAGKKAKPEKRANI